MKVLNLYAGIGSNRKLWQDVHVTAIEINPEIASIYKDYFPDDNVIVGNAHDYLLNHYKEYDFIWSSPPCQSHSRFRKNVACNVNTDNPKGRYAKPIYPDLRLYEEIIFLEHYFKGKYVVENVQAYYTPLVKPQKLQRHWFWCNFLIPEKKFKSYNIATSKIKALENHYGFDLSKYKISSRKNGQNRSQVTEKDQILRNCVDPEVALFVFKQSFKQVQEPIKQTLF